jgi:hypothetical protein
VPDGARSVLLCRYRGLNPQPKRPGTLARARTVTTARIVRRLARELDALGPFPPRARACPKDDGSEVVAFFRYARTGDDPVAVTLGGCP